MKKEILLFVLVSCLFFKGFGQTEKGKFYLGGSTSFLFNKSKEVPDVNLDNYQTTSNIVDFNYSEDTEVYDFTPSVGYFIIDNLVLGISAFLDYQKRDYREGTAYSYYTDESIITIAKSEMKTIGYSFVISPMVKYYMDLNASKSFKVFYKASVGFGSSKKEIKTLDLVDRGGLSTIENPIANVRIEELEDYSVQSSYSLEESSLVAYQLGTGLSYFLSQNISFDFSINYVITTHIDKKFGGSRRDYTSKGFESGLGVSIYL